GYRVADNAAYPAEAGIFTEDFAMDFVSARVGRPEDRAVLKMVVAADSVRSAGFIGYGIAEKTVFPAELRPFFLDCAVDFMSAGPGRPVDRAALEVVVPADCV